jgi:hypothetical protein
LYKTISDRHAQNTVVCLPQDLDTLYVYWDFTELRSRIVNDFVMRIRPEYRLSIRMCRFNPESGEHIPEREVGLERIESGNYYFRNLSPENHYCFEIGAAKPDGDFIRFYQTVPVRMQATGQIGSVEPENNRFEATGEGKTDPTGIFELERRQRLDAVSSWS